MTQFSMTNSTEGCFQLRYALAGKSGLLLKEMFPYWNNATEEADTTEF